MIRVTEHRKRSGRVGDATAVPYATRPPVSRSPLRLEVRRLLLDALVRGDFPPGAGLNEADLATRLGVSRTPLREALLALAREGFLAAFPGRGFSVRELTVRDAHEIYPILWTLEGLALRSAWPLPAARIQALEQTNRHLARARNDPGAALARDRAWHSVLLADCPNRLLLDMIENLKDQAARYEDAFMRHSGRIITSIAQHREIHRALRSKKLEAALHLLEKNWRVSLEFLEPWLAEREAKP